LADYSRSRPGQDIAVISRWRENSESDHFKFGIGLGLGISLTVGIEVWGHDGYRWLEWQGAFRDGDVQTTARYSKPSYEPKSFSSICGDIISSAAQVLHDAMIDAIKQAGKVIVDGVTYVVKAGEEGLEVVVDTAVEGANTLVGALGEAASWASSTLGSVFSSQANPPKLVWVYSAWASGAGGVRAAAFTPQPVQRVVSVSKSIVHVAIKGKDGRYLASWPAGAVTVKMVVTPSDLQARALPPDLYDQVKIYRWDEASYLWKPLPTRREAGNKFVANADWPGEYMAAVSLSGLFGEKPHALKMGDIDGDGDVDQTDFARFCRLWGQYLAAGRQYNSATDANFDGRVNISDPQAMIERVLLK
ncbi:MAG: hypothetical protein H5T86_06080, partial [Armatimonadetes bacterium]|nr:hypothetical protein [Armatimonadota bacterium]